MSASPRTNGGEVLRDLRLPDFRRYGLDVPAPGGSTGSATGTLGPWLRDVIKANPETFRLFGPDETASNRLQAVFEATNRTWTEEILPSDDNLAIDGRVMEVLSEHLCQGWLEGYLLTGRHGLFSCYEAFIHIVDSMVNQHAKWLKTTREIPWRRPLASLNYLLTSHVWRQDHNGFSHQDPGFIDHVVNKKAEIVRVYLPPDANCLLSVADHCLRSRHYINVIISGKQPALQYLTMEEAIAHCTRGIGSGLGEHGPGPGAGRRPGLRGRHPDARGRRGGGDPARAPARAAGALRQRRRPDAPAGRPRASRTACRGRVRRALHRGQADRLRLPRLSPADPRADLPAHEPRSLHVRGYNEEGTTTTPFDMVMLNDLDRFRLVMDVIDRVPGLAARAAHLRQDMEDARLNARIHTRRTGDDQPDLRDFVWPGEPGEPVIPGRRA
jgi:xylulose-5-phosphate/fructose-6-phosphate phosphoketolase